MAFLDRLVSDLIKSSTGFNARPFVRAIGGRNLVLLGGAAIAGALAADKMRASSPETPSVPPPPPPIPPVPGTTAPPPPPIPRSPSSEPEIPRTLLFAIVRTMVAAALADGEMHAEEKKLIESRLGESGLSQDQIERIRKDTIVPPSPNELATAVTAPDEREMLYRFAALVVLSDSETTDLEKAWLGKLASALGVEEARCRELQQEIFQAT